ncbi:MAG: carboxylate-amine ligase [Thermoleophilaceae bacterium]
MEHAFTGPSYTVGIEEELMIVDAETLDLSNSIDAMLESPPGGPGHVQAELMESVLEVATTPCADVPAAGEQLRALRQGVRAAAGERGLAIGSAGTHPFALWEEQRIVPRDRYRGLVAELGFVARQELIFGMHVHVGVDDPEKAIYVVNGLRLEVPLLIALAANSPFWRADATGLACSRMPIFRAFPRVGLPPAYLDFADYVERIEFMVRSKVMSDYTLLWYDVRPHPRLGTVEVRAMDSQTRIEHTVGIAALIQAMVRELCEHFDEGRPAPSGFPTAMLDENRWLAARKGLDGELVDLPRATRVPARERALGTLERLREHARELGAEAELAGVEDLIEKGTGAARQLLVYEANNDLTEVIAEIVAETAV